MATDAWIGDRVQATDEASQASQALKKDDAVSTVPTMVRGDWVLFHPVYTPEELRSVEVGLGL